MSAVVYFMDLRTTYQDNLLQKLTRLLDAASLSDAVAPRDLVAIKLHFGELGNAAFIRPILIRGIVDRVRNFNGVPFLTDANTLYAGSRGNAADHLETAVKNGFSPAVVNAPLIIADGLRGKSETAVTVQLKRYETVFIANEIFAADAMISAAHFKGHELSGFGGAIKNVGMGCASRKGKMAQHADVGPKIKAKNCIGCGECVAHCAESAITLVKEKAVIDEERCIGCGECIIVCPNDAVRVRWNQSGREFLENMAKYTLGALFGKKDKSLFINFITDVSPGCDCLPHNDAAIVRDIGVVASRDPVAADQAALDLVNAEPALPGSCLTTNTAPGEDKFRGVYPEVDGAYLLEYAEEIGLGTRQYRLESV